MTCLVQRRVLEMMFGGLLMAVLTAATTHGQAPQANRQAATAAPSGAVGEGLRAPYWHPLPADQQQWVEDVLKYWEFKSSQVKRYRCNFRRWEYDPVFGPRDTFKAYSEGAIKYAAPDKGMFKVEKIMHYQPPAKAGDQPAYVNRSDDYLEHWICDGTAIFQHDYQKKQLIEIKLPPEMHGQGIAESPLPFLFGAKANRIKARYWLRNVTPPDAKGEYWLEAYPKTAEDAANYLKVHVIIDEQDFLPKGLVVFDRNYNERTMPKRTTFMFDDREVNWSILAQQLNLFHREFFEPATPSGWQKVVKDYQSSDSPRVVEAPSGNRAASAAASKR